MKAKEILSQYIILKGRINAKLEKILELKESVTSLSYALSEKVQTSKQTHGTEKIISIYLDMQNELTDDVIELKEKQKEITKLINENCKDFEHEIMERKYINGENFAIISVKMGFCERQIYRMHGKALEKIDKIL
ncbi:MAG: hypothetical protein R3Y35_09525 [Clostridia bacterium]